MLKFDLIEKAGSVRAVADLFGISRAAVYAWPRTVPELRQYQLQKLRPHWFRGGKLKT